MNLRHSRCGAEVQIAVLRHDVAIYVWCETCHDIVEEGELLPLGASESKVRLRVDAERVRPFLPTEES